MTQPDSRLDQFESALLTELRRYAAEQPAPAPVPVRRRRRLAAVSLAGLAAGTAAVVGLTTLGGSPAYAVNTNADGDVVVTVHRLDDAAGLEKALAAQGIDADVSYDADGSNGPTTVGIGPDGQPVIGGDVPDPPPVTEGDGGRKEPEAGTIEKHSSVTAGGEGDAGAVTESEGLPPGEDPCGFTPGGPSESPADLTKSGSDWVLTIPAGSPLMDRHVTIGTSAQGELSVFYEGDQPGSFCGVSQLKMQKVE